MIDSPDQTDGRTSRRATNHDHLQRARQPGQDVGPTAPTHHHARLDPAKGEERHGHDPDAPPQRHVDLVPMDAKVRDQRHQPAEEVTHADGERAHKRPRRVRLGRLVVEAHEEVDHGGGGVEQRLQDCRHRVRGQGVRFENGADEGRGLGG